VDDL
jgi:hypothetical protein